MTFCPYCVYEALLLILVVTTDLSVCVTGEMDDGDEMSDSGSQKGDAGLTRTDYSQLIVWHVFS